MIEIDGSYGEGGGQILRTSLSLSCLFNKPFRIFNIRKGRKKPGLMPQHLTSVRASQLISNADVEKDEVGSTELIFIPHEVKGGEFLFDVDTAGSTSLVLQTLIPSLIFSKELTTIILKGGTHVPFSPSFHYLLYIFRYFLNKIGISIDLSIEKYGFYPKGGGKIKAQIKPASGIKPLNINKREEIKKIDILSYVSNLPIKIAERQKESIVNKISNLLKDTPYKLNIDLQEVPSIGQGTFAFLFSEYNNTVAGFTSLGEKGKKAEQVGEEAANEFIDYHNSGSALDPHISDQIVLYLSFADKESLFTTSKITQHLLSNLWVIKSFKDIKYTINGELNQPGEIRIIPNPKYPY
jgi:RNA 3'-terminal phosphate cyclase (ATP)